MFCPQCGASNNLDQKFCRQCGKALTAVRLAMEGRVDEALEKLKKGEDSLASGAINLAIFSSIAFLVMFLGPYFEGFEGDRWPLINIVLGLLIGLPLIVRGVIRLESARKILEAEDQKNRAADELINRPKAELPEAPITAPTIAAHKTPASVTEHTTYDLEPPDQSR
jgi:hypothetical protein